MSADYVRSRYGVDFKRGDRVTVDGKPGTVVSFPDQYVGVRFDGDTHTSRCHPTWRIESIESGEIVNLLAALQGAVDQARAASKDGAR